ncbi:MAG: hypothetical protein K0Q72_3777 [Armatimonadetes bacterium]|jgi:uncharacterized protein CbrC (UPF0167 family)|nr:hypothetical protein [Armatimonadota bacterium]
MEQPVFKYHPDPLASGSIIAAAAPCKCCGEARGYLYQGPVYAREELSNSLCPWCIADGSAHARFGATFTDDAGIGGYGDWDPVSDVVVQEVARRTPGFSAWQQERWWTHCWDAAAYLGSAGKAEIAAFGPELLAALQEECGLEGEEWDYYLNAMSREGSPTAYVFRCLRCGKLGGYSDCD